jgi:hypothetical protein
MTDWLPLNANTLAPPKHRTIRGVDITLVMSPYDIPDAVRGEYNKDSHRFIIEFRYMSDEPWERSKYNDKVLLRIGRNSGRLYGIEVDTRAPFAERIDLRMNVAKTVKNALHEFSHQSGRPQRRENFEIAKDAIEENENEIFESLAMA